MSQRSHITAKYNVSQTQRETTLTCLQYIQQMTTSDRFQLFTSSMSQVNFQSSVDLNFLRAVTSIEGDDNFLRKNFILPFRENEPILHVQTFTTTRQLLGLGVRLRSPQCSADENNRHHSLHVSELSQHSYKRHHLGLQKNVTYGSCRANQFEVGVYNVEACKATGDSFPTLSKDAVASVQSLAADLEDSCSQSFYGMT